MDGRNLSAEETRVLKQVLQMRQQQQPGPGESIFRPRKTVEEMYQMLYSSMAHAESQKMYTGVVTNEDPKGATSPSRKPIEALKRISIHGLEPFLGRPAYGHVLLVTLIHAPCQQVAIQMLVEDGEGTAINMSLYNVIVSSTGKCTPLPDLLQVIPVGTRMAIKDPYLKIYSSGMSGLRVDHIGNVLVREDGGKGELVPLKESKEFVKLFVKERGKDGGLAKLTAIKEKGNAFFVKKNYEAAADVYADGLAISQPYGASSPETIACLVTLNSNLAVAFLRLYLPRDARLAAEAALSLDPSQLKAAYRLAQAESALGRHKHAIKGFEALANRVKGGRNEGTWAPMVAEALRKAKRRAQDAKGHFFVFPPVFAQPGISEEVWREAYYDPMAIKVGAFEFIKRLEKDEVGMYVGPVEIRRAGGKGRGLFVTEDVKAGTVVLVERGLAVVAGMMDDEEHGWENGGEEEAATAFLEDGMEELHKALQKRAAKNPVENARLLSLCVGEEDEGRMKEIPPMELFKTDAPDDEDDDDDDDDGERRGGEGGRGRKALVKQWLEKKVIELERIEKVVTCNSIGTGNGARTAAIALGQKAALAGMVPMPTQMAKIKKSKGGGGMKKKAEEVCVGMWPLASFMNKDDERPTAGRVRVGKFLVVRASRNLKRGEELLTIYLEGQAAREGKSEEELREARRRKARAK